MLVFFTSPVKELGDGRGQVARGNQVPELAQAQVPEHELEERH